MLHPKDISIEDFDYQLPTERIAHYPEPERDSSRLLIYKDGKIITSTYRNISDFLPNESLLVFNNSKVINARLQFHKESGGSVEIFCLEPLDNPGSYSDALSHQSPARWKCLVGNLGKTKEKTFRLVLKVPTEGNTEESNTVLCATILEKISDGYVVEFSWSAPDLSFSEVIRLAGFVPLPPYIKRKVETLDTERYQTIYAEEEGSVAAPTAGLHFTADILGKLAEKQIRLLHVTLHVGAGTFKPVKAASMAGHDMHAEWMEILPESISQLRSNLGNIFAVGTTSARTLETMYWLGLKCLQNESLDSLSLGQWEVYETDLNSSGVTSDIALQALESWLEERQIKKLLLQTQLLIAPSYQFRIINGLVTNFHQPRSTLLLLVAAATKGNWRNLYNYAMENDFRFLSYGDGSLIYL